MQKPAVDVRHRLTRCTPAMWHCLILSCLLAVPGCGGCNKTELSPEEAKKQAAEKLKKEKEKPRDPLEAAQAVLQPTVNHVGNCKPGHWTSSVLPDARANRDDFQGDLVMQVVVGNGSERHLAPMFASAYELTASRAAVLAKESPKSLESFFWAPTALRRCELETRLAASRGGLQIEQLAPFQPMPSYQYFLVVASRKPARYEFLDKRLDSIHARHPVLDASLPSAAAASPLANYVVALLDPKGRVKLPSQALCWTSIAVLLWDDADPAQFDAQQQTALIDWLHWGGRIVVSGPDSLETLRSSFLGPLLPVEAAGTRTLAADDLKELSHWAVERGSAPAAKQPWSAVAWNARPELRAVPHTGGLVVERSVGRGTIVVSAFRLSTKELLDWRGCDCFFNACLLGRPPRILGADNDNKRTTVDQPRPDARHNTSLRFFSRDEQRSRMEYAPDTVAADTELQQESDDPNQFVSEMQPGVSFDPQAEFSGGPGMAAWNDFGPAPAAARSILVDAAGIRVPDRSFIIKIVAAYLILLVPVNWLIFRAVRRVEWAWIAAPLIAVFGTVAVIRLAQLNVGFAQAQHEVDIVEMHAGYARAHVTRYTALYTSLASSYDFHMSDPNGLILPFPRVSRPEEFRLAAWQSRRTLDCRRAEATDMSGFAVASNSIDFVHSECMTDLGGAIVARKSGDGRLIVTNHTKLPLTNCRLLRRADSGAAVTLAGLGDLPPEGSASIGLQSSKFVPFHDGSNLDGTSFEVPAVAEQQSNLVANGADNTKKEVLRKEVLAPPRVTIVPSPESAGQPSGELTLGALEAVALNPSELRPGAIRLVARTDAQLAGFDVTPSPAAQDVRRATLVVVNLDAGQHSDPQPDQVSKSNQRP